MDNFVKQIIKRLEIEFNKKDRSGVYGLTQTLLAYNSNKIEGNTLTEGQTAFLFETGTLLASGEIFKAKDIEEMTGHFSMFNEMLKTINEPLSHEIIKLYHYRLKSGVFEDIANGYPIGEYKNRKNRVFNIETIDPIKVTQVMDDLIDKYNSLKEINLSDLVSFHAGFEQIHPFQDGNGRVGRIILFKECLKNNIVPFVINDKNKSDYYNTLNIAQKTNNILPLLDFFKKEQKEYREITEGYVLEYTSEPKSSQPKFTPGNKE